MSLARNVYLLRVPQIIHIVASRAEQGFNPRDVLTFSDVKQRIRTQYSVYRYAIEAVQWLSGSHVYSNCESLDSLRLEIVLCLDLQHQEYICRRIASLRLRCTYYEPILRIHSSPTSNFILWHYSSILTTSNVFESSPPSSVAHISSSWKPASWPHPDIVLQWQFLDMRSTTFLCLRPTFRITRYPCKSHFPNNSSLEGSVGLRWGVLRLQVLESAPSRPCASLLASTSPENPFLSNPAFHPKV